MEDVGSTPFNETPGREIHQITEEAHAKPRKSRLFIFVLTVLVVLLALWNVNMTSQISKLQDADTFKNNDLYQAPLDIEAFIKKISASIVDITCGNYGGTGFAYALEGLDPGYKTFVVTNHHVIENCIEDTSLLSVTYGGSKKLETKSKMHNWDVDNDLALIQIEVKLPRIEDSEVFAEPGWWTMAIGNPTTVVKKEGGVIFNATTFGSIIGVEDEKYNYTSATINHGNSGGPLVNREGKLIGINTLTFANQTEGIWNVAVDSGVLCVEILKCGAS